MEYISGFSKKIRKNYMKKTNVGVIGNGKWAKVMLPKIAKYANIKLFIIV